MPRGLAGGRGGSPEKERDLQIQLPRLASWEDPANPAPVAVAYREMLTAVGTTHREPERHWGEFGEYGNPAKRRKTS